MSLDKRLLAALLSTSVLVACATAPATRGQIQPRTTSVDAPVEFLLASAATDFHTHRPPDPARFRDVRIGYVSASDGTRHYMLCGEFSSSRDERGAEWTPFVTIKTSGYEQYLGTQAADFCRRPSTVWVDGDFSSPLQARLESLK